MASPKLIAMRGLPASGKTTLARKIAKEQKAVVVGRDFERFQLFGEWWTGEPADEDRVTIAINAKVEAFLLSGQSVIVDNTHIKPRYLKEWANLALRLGADFDVVDVKTPEAECITRDMKRIRDGERGVGRAVIDRMARQIKWTDVKVDNAPVEPYENPVDLPHAIIVDIDGTLAHMSGRSPYDYTRVHEDTVDEAVADLVYVLSSSEDAPSIIVCSGRDDECRDVTEAWLNDNNVPYHSLLMRPTDAKDSNGNKLPDRRVKYDLFNEHIRGKYHVRFVLDDRNQVVDMWRQLGLKCLQVAPGDF